MKDFWGGENFICKPENSSKFDLFQKHRDELNEFAHEVADISIRVAYKSYAEL